MLIVDASCLYEVVADGSRADVARARMRSDPDHAALVARAWGLRDRIRRWDGLYVALAEALEATLFTFDERLARVAGSTCAVEIPDRY